MPTPCAAAGREGVETRPSNTKRSKPSAACLFISPGHLLVRCRDWLNLEALIAGCGGYWLQNGVGRQLQAFSDSLPSQLAHHSDASLALAGGLSSDPVRCPIDWYMGVGKGGGRRLSPAVATKSNYM